MGPTICTGPGVLSTKVESLQGAAPHLHTQTSYAGTRDNTRRWVYMPATIVVAHGLVRPKQWCGWRFFAMGLRVKGVHMKLKIVSLAISVG